MMCIDPKLRTIEHALLGRNELDLGVDRFDVTPVSIWEATVALTYVLIKFLSSSKVGNRLVP